MSVSSLILVAKVCSILGVVLFISSTIFFLLCYKQSKLYDSLESVDEKCKLKQKLCRNKKLFMLLTKLSMCCVVVATVILLIIQLSIQGLNTQVV